MAGRTRDERIDAAVLAAARQLLDTDGYTDLSIGQVAAVAGVHRPAIYRRWPSKRHLVVDVVADLLGVTPTPDTGDLRADLTVSLRALVRALRDTCLNRVLPALVADLADDPTLRERLLTTVFEPRRATTAAALRSAMARGEVDPDMDLDFVLDTVAAPIYFRALFGHLPLSDELADQSVDAVLRVIAR
ncbi:TetR/AcrR family transcriptional regulator [Nocardia paucivorans]|uniref:TetR/AcrR family transcriptional regulator n=1 Tax=Nocardia paucivorans TaxID=114259 RepID=UPI0002DF809F|nr:TetR/AcrR family transcriptional regulator [Nocardia paucivorans]